MSTRELSKRGAVWLDALTYSAPLQADYPPSVRVVDARLGDHPVRYMAVIPDPAAQAETRIYRRRSGAAIPPPRPPWPRAPQP